MAAEHALITAVCDAGRPRRDPGRPLRRDLPARRQGALALGPRVHDGRPDRPRRGRGARCADDTRLVWVETPTNPTLKVIDVPGVVARARRRVRRGRQHVRDAGLPAAAGARRGRRRALDDQVPGRALGRRRRRGRRARSEARTTAVRFVQNSIGAVPGPLDCFLVHRGLRTLHLRMAAHTENARVVVGVAGGRRGRLRRPLARDLGDGLVPASGRGRDRRRATQRLLAGRVARRRGVADRGPAGDDAPVRRGLRRPRCRPISCGSRAGSRRAEDLVEDLAQAIGVD